MGKETIQSGPSQSERLIEDGSFIAHFKVGS